MISDGRNSGGSANPHPDHSNRSPPDDREDTRTSEGESHTGRHHDVTHLQQQDTQSVSSISGKLQDRKRKLVRDEESTSGEEDEEDESIMKTPSGRSHALSPASSNHSIPANEVAIVSSPKVRRTEVVGPETSENATTGGTSVKDLEQAMSKHLPGASLGKSDSPTVHQPTDFSTDALLKQQQRSTIQWIGAHHHLGHMSPQQSSAAPLPASALLRQLYANRESVIRANVHGIASSGRSTSGGGYYSGDSGPQNGPLPTPPGSEGSSTYGDHQFVLSGHNQKSANTSGTDAFTSLVSSYSSTGSYAVDYHSAMTPPSSVSPRDKQQQQLHATSVVASYESAVYSDSVLRHQYEPAQPLPLKPQVYSAAVHPTALDAAAAYASASLSEQPQFYHHPATGAGFHLYHPTNKTATNGWYSSAS